MIADILSPYILTEGGYTTALGEYPVEMWAVQASLPPEMLPAPNLAYLRVQCPLEVLTQIEADSRFLVVATYG